MSNQPQAHVADDIAPCPFCGGAAVRIGMEKNLAQCTDCKATADIDTWNRRAVGTQYVDVASIDTPEFLEMLGSYANDGTNGYGYWHAKIVNHINAWGARRAAGAPAETPKPYAYELWDGDDPKGREDSLLVFGPDDPAHAPGASDHQGHVWVSMPLYAAQPAPARATDARDAIDAARYRWLCDNNFDREGVTQIHTIVKTWEPHSQTGYPQPWSARVRGGALDREIDAAMLSANSPREAG